MANIYLSHYSQYGKGFNDIGPIFYSRNIVQKGRGFGGFFRALYRYVKPLLSGGLRLLKTEGLKTGANILSDLAAGTKPARDILKERGKQTLTNIGNKIKKTYQEGSGMVTSCIKKKRKKKSGIKTKKPSKTRHSVIRPSSKQIKKQRKSKKIFDIFS